ncbi:MAG: iron ABC transporter permease [Clostridia bacterium]|nr:iron ABC transporter permease [Clostridia bacterium]
MKHKKAWLFIAISFAMLVVSLVLSLSVGARDIPISDLIATLRGESVNALYAPILTKRIIRTVLGLLAGLALGTAGCVMQSITRNPIADPSILGVNSGAALFVVSGIAFFGAKTPGQYIALALAGAGIISVLVFGIASFVPGKGAVSYNNANPIRLALAGAAVSTACSSLISTVMLPRTNVTQEFRFWQVGSISGGTWNNILTVLPLLVVGMVLAILLTPSLNALALGDDIATGLGVNVTRTRALGALSGVLLCGAITALTGPIGFVGLMVPHLVRIFCGVDLRVQIPVSAMDGALLLILADVLGRYIGRPGELEVGIVTAFLGAPVFILVVRKAKVGKL